MLPKDLFTTWGINMAQYQDLFGFDRFAQAQDMARQWQRQQQQDDMALSQMRESQRRNALAERYAGEDRSTKLNAMQQQQGAENFMYQNLPFIQGQPEIYGEQSGVLMQDIAKNYPGADLGGIYQGLAGMQPKQEKFKYQERDLPVTSSSIQKQEMLPDGTWRNIGVPLQKWDRSQPGSTATGDSGRVGPGGKTPKSKVLPPSVVKLQQEAVDQLAIASNTERDLTDIVAMLDDPKLDLGPVDNLTSKALNYAGMSTDNSRAYGTLVATIEKLRNDSLRLNKGVQTDGDAVRAMNEIIANPNDKAYVKQRLQTIARANKRWADIQEGHIKNIRDNYDLEQLDTGSQRQPENVTNPKVQANIQKLSDADLLKALGGK